MDWDSIFFGFLQGITEFLPVSSSGHLFLLEQLLKQDKARLSFVLILHGATLLSILAVFFREIKSLFLGIKSRENLQLFFKVLLSLLPLVFVGVFLKDVVEQSFQKNVVALGFFSSGLLLFSLFFVKTGRLSLREMSFFKAFLIGLFQCVAVLPGFSRSGWTIAMGLYCGLAPRSAVYYSFLISLPAIAGSVLVDLFGSVPDPSLKGIWFEFTRFNTGLSLFLSLFVAFLSGFISLLLVLKLVQSDRLPLFSFYLFPLGVFIFFFL